MIRAYWGLVVGNIAAMPLEFLITCAVAFVFRGPLGRLLGRDALREAKAARRIAADLYSHHTGRAHPEAPVPETESEAR